MDPQEIVWATLAAAILLYLAVFTIKNIKEENKNGM